EGTCGWPNGSNVVVPVALNSIRVEIGELVLLYSPTKKFDTHLDGRSVAKGWDMSWINSLTI
ncbi:hypothetical protein, partial [Actinobacillus pleuropneumoniae]